MVERQPTPLPQRAVRLILFADGSYGTYINNVKKEDSDRAIVQEFEFIPAAQVTYDYPGTFGGNKFNNPINQSFIRSYPEALCIPFAQKPMVTIWVVLANPLGDTKGYNIIDNKLREVLQRNNYLENENNILLTHQAFLIDNIQKIGSGNQALRDKFFSEIKIMLDAVTSQKNNQEGGNDMGGTNNG